MNDVLAGLTRRQLEDLKEKIDKELQECILCHREGADHFRVTGKIGQGASLLLCKPCFERYRLPESRSADTA